MKLEQEHRHGRNDDGGSCVVPVICRAEIDFYSCIVQISVYFSILLRYFMDVPNRFIVGKVPNLQQFGAICQYDQQTSIAPLKVFFQSKGFRMFCVMPVQVAGERIVDLINNS
ncbi:uncharacterized protein LOC131068045 isoform X2 [Cryptomeria japonica]|uniref:uncharacterized protein LOC131068045 isoform X2 n=1 Tax=Cryptomeria japonica TaxID=3369 RepID=UPI0025ABE97C|nr:uncharacterized protein LOC131068045 isoform X2 [Cryptomeria japonica]